MNNKVYHKTEDNKLFLVLILIMVAGHILMFLVPPLNMEDISEAASQYFRGTNERGLSIYFKYQANTLVYPWLGSIISKTLNLDCLSSLRILSLLGSFLLGKSFLLLTKRYGLSSTILPYLYLIFYANPLIFIFSSRAMNDTLAFGLASYATALLITDSDAKDPRPWRDLLIIISFSGAFCIKYHTISLYIVSLFILRNNIQKRFRRYIYLSISIIAIAAIFLYAYKSQYGIEVTPERFQNVHKVNIGTIPAYILGYSSYLASAFIPLSITTNWASQYLISILKSTNKIMVAIIISSLIVSYIVILSILGMDAELNLGPLDLLVAKEHREAIGALILTLSIHSLLIPFFLKTNLKRTQDLRLIDYINILGGISIYVLILSLSRPSNRYLIGILPIYLTASSIYLDYKRRLLIITIILSLLGANFAGLTAYANGIAYQRLLSYADEKGILYDLCPGDISAHVSAMIQPENTSDNRICNKTYIVNQGRDLGAIYTIAFPNKFPLKIYSITSDK